MGSVLDSVFSIDKIENANCHILYGYGWILLVTKKRNQPQNLSVRPEKDLNSHKSKKSFKYNQNFSCIT